MAKEHKCNSDCKGYESYRIDGSQYWSALSAKEIESLKTNWVPRHGMIDKLEWEMFPHSSTIELHQRKGRILQDVSVILGEANTLADNSEDDLHTYHAALKEMIAAKMLNEQDLSELAGGTINIDSLIERKIDDSDTDIKRQLWKMKQAEILRIKSNKEKWDDAVKECSQTQQRIIEEAASQLREDTDANKVNKEQVAKQLGLDRSTVSRTLDRVKRNYNG